MSTGFKLHKIYRTGYCLGRAIFADKTRGWKKVRFHTRCFLLEDPKKGLILIDTGYGKDFMEVTQKGIYSLYRTLLPVTYSPEDSIVTQLAQDGITLKDLSYLMITHFHPDHIGALPEFAAVPWIYRCDTLQQLVSLSLLRGLRKGFIRPLVPTVPKGSLPISKQHFTDTWNGDASLDLFGDGSFHLIDLPGHTEGQMGVATQGYFFTADAQWEADASPHPLGVFLQEDRRAYRKTLAWLQTLPSSIQQFPTHTMEAYA